MVSTAVVAIIRKFRPTNGVIVLDASSLILSQSKQQIPILENVSLRNQYVNVIHTGTGRTVDFAMDQFTVERLNENTAVRVTGKGTICGKAFQLEG